MFSVKAFCFGLAVCLPLSAFAAETPSFAGERALREECSAFSQTGMHDCLAQKVSASQESLRRAEEKMANALAHWDEDEPYRTQAAAAFAASKESFSRYRQSYCDFAASLGGGAAGNARDIRRLACVATLNDTRTEQLDDATSDLPLK